MGTVIRFIDYDEPRWDGITDPIIGMLWIDKTDGKMGKFRPFMIMGWVVMTIHYFIDVLHDTLVPENMCLIYFIILYLVYIGYTFQTACTKAGQTVLTNDPEQRPCFRHLMMSYTSLLFAGAVMYVSNYMAPKHGGFTESFFHEFVITCSHRFRCYDGNCCSRSMGT